MTGCLEDLKQRARHIVDFAETAGFVGFADYTHAHLLCDALPELRDLDEARALLAALDAKGF